MGCRRPRPVRQAGGERPGPGSGGASHRRLQRLLPEDSAAIIRAIYAYHTRALGWCDIGYNALVDKYGQVFEGRAGGITKGIVGSHAGGFNKNTWGCR